MPSTLRSDLPSCRPSALADLATKTIAAPAGLWRFLLHRSQLALSSAAVRRCQFRQIPCLLEASQAFHKKTDGRRRALVCRLTAPCRSSGARGCKAVLSSFHERAACSWLVVLRAGVMRGNPPDRGGAPFPFSHHPSEQSSLASGSANTLPALTMQLMQLLSKHLIASEVGARLH